MIARLQGKLVEREGTDIVVDCGGVGYDVSCSAYTLGALPELGAPVTLKVFTHALENKLTLYGFIDGVERALFDLLIKVKNVGPSTAIAILSGATPRDIATLIAKEDVSGLTRIKGVGKKTAEMLVVELRERCEQLLLTWNLQGGERLVLSPRPALSKRHPLIDEVSTALVAMGFKQPEVDAVLVDVVPGPEATLEALLRVALRNMPR